MEHTERTAIQNLQRYLRRIALSDSRIPTVPIDGIFDSQTTEALSEFQRLYGLPVTGRADKGTWERLYTEYNRLRQEEDRLLAPDLFPRVPPNYTPVLGEEHIFISLLQIVLNELRTVYDSLPLLTVTGIFDEETQGAVAEFQRISGLRESGTPDRNTWNRISEEYNHYATGEQ